MAIGVWVSFENTFVEHGGVFGALEQGVDQTVLTYMPSSLEISSGGI